MITGAIIVGILIFALMILWFYINSTGINDFDGGVWLGTVMSILIIIEVGLVASIIEEPIPSALDVYRGNIELEITSVNGIPIDTIVVFKRTKILNIMKKKLNIAEQQEQIESFTNNDNKKHIGKYVHAGGELNGIVGHIIDVKHEYDDIFGEKLWFYIGEEDGTIHKYGKEEIQEIILSFTYKDLE